MNKLQFFTK